MEPWYPSFDPTITSITSDPIWVRLPNLPLHLWNFTTFTSIGNTLGKYYCISPNTFECFKATFDRICVQMDLSQGFLAKLIFTNKDYKWIEKLDYENVLLCCTTCYATCHISRNFLTTTLARRVIRKET